MADEPFVLTPADVSQLPQFLREMSGKQEYLWLSPGIYDIRASLDFPSGVTLVFMRGAELSLAAGVSATIRGDIQAGLQQIVRGEGTLDLEHPDLLPEWFGAKGDGQADDSPAVQSAFRTLQRAGGGRITFSYGRTYLCNSMVGTPDPSSPMDNVTVIGEGATLKSGVDRALKQPAMRLLGSNLIVRRLTFRWVHEFNAATDNNMEGSNSLYIGGLGMPYKDNIRVEGCRFYGSWFAAIRPACANNVTIYGNYVEKALATGIFPGEIGENLTISDNTVVDTKDDAIYASAGPSLPAIRNVLITRNRVRDSNARGIGVGGAHHVTISDNVIDGTYIAGITCDAGNNPPNSMFSREGTRHIKVVNNQLRRIGAVYGSGRIQATPAPMQHGIFIGLQTPGTMESVEIVGNEILDAQGSGMSLMGVRRLNVERNRILRSGGAGISVGFDSAPDMKNVLDFVIDSNDIQDVQTSGIYLTHASFGKVCGNRIREYGAAGGNVMDRAIMAFHCDGVLVSDNVIRNDRAAEQTAYSANCKNVVFTDNFITTPASAMEPMTALLLDRKILFASEEPLISTWDRGDIILNAQPSPGGSIGWVCVEGGKAHPRTTGNLTPGSNRVSGVTPITSWSPGDRIKGSGIPPNARVESVDPASQTLTLDQSATLSGTGVAFYDAVFRTFGAISG